MKTRAAETAAKIADHTKLLLLNIKMRSERRKHCARAGCSKVRTPPARPLSQTHRQDRLQYTAPQLASAQCKMSGITYPFRQPFIDISAMCLRFLLAQLW